jgi:hypothetical protein
MLWRVGLGLSFCSVFFLSFYKTSLYARIPVNFLVLNFFSFFLLCFCCCFCCCCCCCCCMQQQRCCMFRWMLLVPFCRSGRTAEQRCSGTCSIPAEQQQAASILFSCFSLFLFFFSFFSPFFWKNPSNWAICR